METGQFDPAQEGQMLARLRGEVIIRVRASKRWSGRRCRVRVVVESDRAFEFTVVGIENVQSNSTGGTIANGTVLEKGDYEFTIRGDPSAKDKSSSGSGE
jgi:hypothetical protein